MLKHSQSEMVGLGRIELPTYGLGNRRSVQLSYNPALFRRIPLRQGNWCVLYHVRISLVNANHVNMDWNSRVKPRGGMSFIDVRARARALLI